MDTNSRLAAVKMVVMALNEVQAFNGTLPAYDDPESDLVATKEGLFSITKKAAADRRGTARRATVKTALRVADEEPVEN